MTWRVASAPPTSTTWRRTWSALAPQRLLLPPPVHRCHRRLQTTSGQLIANLQSSCNNNVTNNWVVETFDVSRLLASYKGRQVTLFFRGTNVNNQYQPTDFFVDDVAITAQ